MSQELTIPRLSSEEKIEQLRLTISKLVERYQQEKLKLARLLEGGGQANEAEKRHNAIDIDPLVAKELDRIQRERYREDQLLLLTVFNCIQRENRRVARAHAFARGKYLTSNGIPAATIDQGEYPQYFLESLSESADADWRQLKELLAKLNRIDTRTLARVLVGTLPPTDIEKIDQIRQRYQESEKLVNALPKKDDEDALTAYISAAEGSFEIPIATELNLTHSLSMNLDFPSATAYEIQLLITPKISSPLFELPFQQELDFFRSRFPAIAACLLTQKKM